MREAEGEAILACPDEEVRVAENGPNLSEYEEKFDPLAGGNR